MNVFKSLRLLSQILVVTLGVWTSIPGTTQTRTWTVEVNQSGDAPTVQAGIDSAAEGDTVLVGPGTYYENIEFRGLDVVLRSLMGPEVTTLDGSLLDSAVVAIRRGEGRETVVEGFRITGGSGGNSVDGEIDFGGGLHVFRAEPIIRGNIIEP